MSVVSDDRRRIVERHVFDYDCDQVQTSAEFVDTSLEVVLNGRLEVIGGRYSTVDTQAVAFDPPLGEGDMLFLTYLPLGPPS